MTALSACMRATLRLQQVCIGPSSHLVRDCHSAATTRGVDRHRRQPLQQFPAPQQRQGMRRIGLGACTVGEDTGW